MKNRNKISSGQVMIFVAGALFCLILLSTALMGGLYAKYLSNGSGGDDARVAMFDVSTTISGVDATFANMSADTNTYKITIQNNSEVAVHCDLVLTFNTDVSDYLVLTVDGKDPVFSDDGKTATFKDIASFAPNNVSGTKICNLVFSVADWEAITSTATDESMSVTYQFQGTLNCVQID